MQQNLQTWYSTPETDKLNKREQELQKRKEKYDDEIDGFYEDFHYSTMDLEAEVMQSYERLEEKRVSEEELHTEIQHMEISHLIEFKKLENEYERRIVTEKLELEKAVNEDFQEKVAIINNKHNTVLNNLKKEHPSSLKIYWIET